IADRLPARGDYHVSVPALLEERPSSAGNPTGPSETPPSGTIPPAPGAARGPPGPGHLYLGRDRARPQRQHTGSVEQPRELEGGRVALGGYRGLPDLPGQLRGPPQQPPRRAGNAPFRDPVPES